MAKIQKIETLLDKGASEYAENGFFTKEDNDTTLLAVCDAFSKPYNKLDKPIQLFGGQSSGEIVKNIFFNALENSKSSDSLLSIIQEADNAVRIFDEKLGLPFRADNLAGLVFAIARINKSTIEILQGGDCTALWKKKDGWNLPSDAGILPGTTGAFALINQDNDKLEIAQFGDAFVLWVPKNGEPSITRNQVRGHDTKMNATIRHLQDEIAKEFFGIEFKDATPDQKRTVSPVMWERFCPILQQARREDVNNAAGQNPYGSLNGQEELMDLAFFNSLPLNDTELVLLFTDGLVPWHLMEGLSDQRVAEAILDEYRRGGLAQMLLWARGVEAEDKTRYTDRAEVTAWVLKF